MKFFTSVILMLLLSCSQDANQIAYNVKVDSISNLAKRKVPVDSINRFIDYKMQEMNISGTSVAIINNGQIVYHTVKGYADKEQEKLVNKQTIFEGASLSKPMFAYMTMFLVEDGRLDLDKPLNTYLDFEKNGIIRKDNRFGQITARMVLSHSTGLPNWSEGNEMELQFDPGTDFSYSGEAYRLLERVVENILQTDYRGLESFYQEKIAKSFNMQVTKFVQNEYNINHKAHPYEDNEKLPLGRWEAPEFNAASSIHSEALDFSNWLVGIMNKRLLLKETYDELFAEQVLVPEESFFGQLGVTNWTLGFAKLNIFGHTVHGHLGNNMGFSSLFLIDRNKKWGIVFFSNAHLAQNFGFELFEFINKDV